MSGIDELSRKECKTNYVKKTEHLKPVHVPKPIINFYSISQVVLLHNL